MSFYKYTCSLVFENAKEKLEKAHVIIDKSGNLDFRRQLAKYLNRKMNEGQNRLIAKVKMQRSESNNLLQLADYVAGVINRSVQRSKKFIALIIGRLSHTGRFMFKFGQNKTSDPILFRNAGDKRHSSGRKQFHYYGMTNNLNLSREIYNYALLF